MQPNWLKTYLLRFLYELLRKIRVIQSLFLPNSSVRNKDGDPEGGTSQRPISAGVCCEELLPQAVLKRPAKAPKAPKPI